MSKVFFTAMNSQQVNFRNFSLKDMKLITGLCERVHYTNPKEPFGNHAFIILKNALGNTYFSVERYRLNPMGLEEAFNEGISRELDRIYAIYMHQHPFATRFRTPGQIKVSTILAETSVAEFHKKELYNEFYRKLGIKDQLAMSVQQGADVCLIVYSRDRPFTEREQAIMQVVRPHVQIAWDNWQRVRELEDRLQLLDGKSVCSEESARQAREAKQLMDGLSPRERDIAELVAQGMENRKIAETLYISPKTVGKHLENIFAALNLHHRAALAAKWRLSSSVSSCS